MPQFPQQIRSERLFNTLQQFYKSADKQIVETFKQFDRRKNSNTEGAEVEDLSELEFNQKQFRRVVREIRQGNEKVNIKWYDAEILSGAPPRLHTKINQFQIKHRYGSWFKEENMIG